MNKRSLPLIELLGCISIYTLLCLLATAYQSAHIHQIKFADDAFYYFVVAHHIVRDGLSTFDGTSLTNGYHPLWMALIALQFKIAGESLLLIRSMEFLIGGAALVFSLLFARLPNALLNLIFTVGFFLVLSRTGLNGMETTLFACCFSLLAYASEKRFRSPLSSGAIDGLLAVLVIGSRIDAAVFVLPFLLFMRRPRSSKAISLAFVAFCGMGYALANRHYFGATVPISGQVKSLGGMQVNRILFSFLVHQPPALLFHATVLVFLLALFLMRKQHQYLNRRFVAAFLVGYVLFTVRLAFASSWVIWPWYDYPLLIGYIACMPSFFTMMADRFPQRQMSAQLIQKFAGALACLTVAGALLTWLYATHFARMGTLSIAGPALPQAVVASLDGARIAMGDCAGSFAYHYPGSVNQLEGIMNDAEYFHALKEKQDVKHLLCERQVRFVVAYDHDLADYRRHTVHTIRPGLSQYDAPGIEVSRADEVVRVPDLSPGKAGGGMPYLYVWRLQCAARTSSTDEVAASSAASE